ncbi:MAG TPA: CHAT domain-containing protein [Leptolyngbyaceae cyanobacterium]
MINPRHRAIWRRLQYWLVALASAIACLLISPALSYSYPPATLAQQSVTLAQEINRGRQHYAEGRYAEAATTWSRAAQQFAAQGDVINQASALANAGLAYLQLGQYAEAETAIATAHDTLSSLSATDYRQRVLAQVHSAQGQLYMAQGNAVEALQALEQAAAAYAEVEDPVGKIRAQLNQAQVLRVQGRYPQMLHLLTTIEAQITDLADPALKAVGFRQLGIALQFAGNSSEAIAQLEKSLAAAEQSGSATEISATLLSLGNVAEATAAVDFYRQAADTAPSVLSQLQAQVNQFRVLVETNRLTEARSLLAEIDEQLPNLPPSRSAFFVRINLASRLLATAPPAIPAAEVARLLAETVQQATALGDGQGQTYGLGYLGHLYEKNGLWQEAVEVTQEALNIAQSINADAATYQWQWQLGRIFEAQENNEAAIAAHRQALATLQRLRSDLVAVNPEVRFSFEDSIEPLYRNLVSLLLQSESPALTTQDNLLQARNVIESLQVEELVNFFRADCVVTAPKQIDQVDTTAAVLYPIILNDRLEVILSLPGQPLRHVPSLVSKAEVDSTLDLLQQTISRPSANIPELASRSRAERARIEIVRGQENTDFVTPAKQVYDWLIRPFEADLANANIDTLVFVLDGTLRNVPMAVLFDGQQYLIQKFAIALTPGLQLLDPQPLAKRQVRALVAGLSEERSDFPPLPNVKAEVEAISAEVPSQVMLDQTFDKKSFESQLTATSFPIVHLATHGQFGETFENTFVLTWDGTINANELSTLLQTGEVIHKGTIEMLVLSACETAAGDNRAALGLAGVAVRSGARSTLATLWLVDDLGTSVLMRDFYQRLATSVQTKAEVLRQAQLNLLQQEQYQHPYFWAPFVLIGNWL